MASVQQTIRDAGVPFTYVLAELESQSDVISVRRDAEQMTERYRLFDSPVLHAGGSERSQVWQHFLEYTAENFPWIGDVNAAFPTLVYVNKRGKLVEVAQGAPATSSEIIERYTPGQPPPQEVQRTVPKLPGTRIETMRSDIEGLAIGNKPKRDLKSLLTKSLRALELRLGPAKSPCSLLSQFRKELKRTNGISVEQKADLTARALSVEALIECG